MANYGTSDSQTMKIESSDNSMILLPVIYSRELNEDLEISAFPYSIHIS